MTSTPNVAGSVVDFSPDGRFAVVRPQQNELLIQNLQSREVLLRIPFGSRAIPGDKSGNKDGKQPIRGSLFSPDGQFILMVPEPRLLEVWKIGEGTKVAMAVMNGSLTGVSWVCGGKKIAIADSIGSIEISSLENQSLGAAITTARYEFHPTSLLWDDLATFICPACGRRLSLDPKARDAISTMHNAAAPPLDWTVAWQIPEEAFSDTALLSTCPSCHHPLRFNPFIVDNRDRY